MTMIESETEINTPKDVRQNRSFSITDLLNLCEDQNRLLREEDKQFEQLVAQLSEYEQELYEKDVYIEMLECKLKQYSKTSIHREEGR